MQLQGGHAACDSRCVGHRFDSDRRLLEGLQILPADFDPFSAAAALVASAAEPRATAGYLRWEPIRWPGDVSLPDMDVRGGGRRDVLPAEGPAERRTVDRVCEKPVPVGVSRGGLLATAQRDGWRRGRGRDTEYSDRQDRVRRCRRCGPRIRCGGVEQVRRRVRGRARLRCTDSSGCASRVRGWR
jgi:hypothetical protein